MPPSRGDNAQWHGQADDSRENECGHHAPARQTDKLSGLALWHHSAPAFEGESYSSTSSRWLRAKRSGLCQVLPVLGEHVAKGDPLALVYDPSSMEESIVHVQHGGMVIGVQRQAVVYRGDALAHLAEVEALNLG